ncbi:hypothetical protein BST61_g2655 [Cercospora zeina]
MTASRRTRAKDGIVKKSWKVRENEEEVQKEEEEEEEEEGIAVSRTKGRGRGREWGGNGDEIEKRNKVASKPERGVGMKDPRRRKEKSRKRERKEKKTETGTKNEVSSSRQRANSSPPRQSRVLSAISKDGKRKPAVEEREDVEEARPRGSVACNMDDSAGEREEVENLLFGRRSGSRGGDDAAVEEDTLEKVGGEELGLKPGKYERKRKRNVERLEKGEQSLEKGKKSIEKGKTSLEKGKTSLDKGKKSPVKKGRSSSSHQKISDSRKTKLVKNELPRRSKRSKSEATAENSHHGTKKNPKASEQHDDVLHTGSGRKNSPAPPPRSDSSSPKAGPAAPKPKVARTPATRKRARTRRPGCTELSPRTVRRDMALILRVNLSEKPKQKQKTKSKRAVKGGEFSSAEVSVKTPGTGGLASVLVEALQTPTN